MRRSGELLYDVSDASAGKAVTACRLINAAVAVFKQLNINDMFGTNLLSMSAGKLMLHGLSNDAPIKALFIFHNVVHMSIAISVLRTRGRCSGEGCDEEIGCRTPFTPPPAGDRSLSSCCADRMATPVFAQATSSTPVGTPTQATDAAAQSATVSPSGDQGVADQQAGSGVPDDDIVVTGVRASLQSAQNIKRNADQIVDSIVAEDIGKLPDRNVAEALQRVTGVQIQRSYGEGSSVAIRGLSQVRIEINGRDIFTASGGRSLSLEDVPSELLAGVDVYKNPSAELIEGGIGGLINLRTRKPFDFDGFKLSASGGVNYYDLYGVSKPQANLLVSDRWNTGIGEIGVLVDVAFQQTAFRQDQISSQPFYLLNEARNADGTFVNPVDAATAAGLGRTGKPTYLSHGVGIGEYLGDRRRLGVDVALQWKPTDTLQFTGEYIRSDYNFRYADYSYFAYTGDNPITPDFTKPFTYDEDGNFRSGTFVNVPTNANTSLETRHSVTSDYSLNAKWTPSDRLTINGDFQYIRGTTDGQRSIVILGSTAESLFLATGDGVPTMLISPDTNAANGNGLTTDPANYASGAGYLDHIEHSVGTEYAGALMRSTPSTAS